MAASRAPLRLVDPATGRVLAERLQVPSNFLTRGVGLMGRRDLPAGEAMWIAPCNGIHMFFMRFALDLIFLDRAQRVVRVYSQLRPWRVVPLVRGAHSVVELPAGATEGADLSRGRQLAIEPDPAG
ncbi:MAG: DUF192 domain-containing protein [Candidatus Dormibacteraeota bacterium]|nr:DUF192 domain-containing protein [Candidatus Dormibacteraeota bacterium]